MMSFRSYPDDFYAKIESIIFVTYFSRSVFESIDSFVLTSRSRDLAFQYFLMRGSDNPKLSRNIIFIHRLSLFLLMMTSIVQNEKKTNRHTSIILCNEVASCYENDLSPKLNQVLMTYSIRLCCQLHRGDGPLKISLNESRIIIVE